MGSHGLALKALMLLKYIDQKGGKASLDETLDFLGIDRKTFRKIARFISLCGIYPYTPADLIFFEVEKGEISAILPRDVDLQIQLNSAEAFALLSAIEFLKTTPAGQLEDFARIFEKISNIFPDLMKDAARELSERIEMVFDLPYEEKVRFVIDNAISKKRKVEIDYAPITGGRTKTYRICPYRVYYEFHNFYLWALDEADEQVKCFLCSRILQARPVEEPFEPEERIFQEIEKIHQERFELLDFKEKALLRYVDYAARIVDEEARFTGKRWVDDNVLEVEVPLISAEWVLRRWVLPYAGHVDIIQPEHLRKELKEILAGRIKELEA